MREEFQGTNEEGGPAGHPSFDASAFLGSQRDLIEEILRYLKMQRRGPALLQSGMNAEYLGGHTYEELIAETWTPEDCVDASLIPCDDGTIDLGMAGKAWARLFMSNGSDSAPSITFGGDTNTGFARPAADMVAAIAGARRIASFFENGGTDHEFIVYSGDGSLGAVFSIVSNRLINAGQTIFTFGDGGTTGSAIRVADGTETVPFYSFSNDSGLGMWRDGNDTLAFSANGNRQLRITDGTITSEAQILAPVGSESAPSYSTDGDSNSGLTRGGSNGTLALVCDANTILGLTTSLIVSNQEHQFEGPAVLNSAFQPKGVHIDDTDSPYTVGANDHIIIANAVSGAIAVNMPPASEQREVIVVRSNAVGSSVTADADGSDSITDAGVNAGTNVQATPGAKTYFTSGDGVWHVI